MKTKQHIKTRLNSAIALRTAFYGIDNTPFLSFQTDKTKAILSNLANEFNWRYSEWRDLLLKLVKQGRHTVNGTLTNTFFNIETAEPFDTFPATIRGIENAKNRMHTLGIVNEKWIPAFYAHIARNFPNHKEHTVYAMDYLQTAVYFHPEWQGKPKIADLQQWVRLFERFDAMNQIEKLDHEEDKIKYGNAPIGGEMNPLQAFYHFNT